jgi:hypothetical protein
MKVLVFVKATPRSEKGIVEPSAEMSQMFLDMGKFNEQLVKAGIMKEGDGLKPSSFGKRVHFSGNQVSVVDGPFAETKELVAGYWVWEVKSMDEALEWARRCPNPMPGEEGILELRPTNTLEDFAELLTDEHRAQFDRTSQALERQMTPKAKAKAKSKAKAKAGTKPKAQAKAKAKPAAKRKPARAKAKK